MNKDETVVSTIEELEQFIDTHENCIVYATKELVSELNRILRISSNVSFEQIDLFFRVYEWMNTMIEKHIIFEEER